MREFDQANQYRIRKGAYGSDESIGKYGAFLIPIARHTKAFVIVDGGDESRWEHVSVHITYLNKRGKLTERTPTWEEMCLIKYIFWGEDEVVMQLHPRGSEYVNVHKNCLHLWKPRDAEVPVPPLFLV